MARPGRQLAMLCTVLLLAAAAALADTRVALVVGNSEYAAVGRLENPENDALDISVALEGLGFEVHTGRNLTKADMRETTRDFATAAARADVVLFYYAGHAFQVDGRNYLLPTDAALSTVSDIPAETLAIDEVLRAMEASPGVKLIFLDACRDNPFGQALGDAPGVEDGLARTGTDANFLFAYATQPDNVAYDGTGRNSFFTEAMLHHLYTPGQDISELMISVRRDVLAATGGRQIPWENSSLTRQFIFDDSPATVSEEALFYQVATGARDAGLLRLYLETYPQGAHAEEALAFLDTGLSTRALELPDASGEQEERFWALARRSRLRPLLEVYLERYPEGAHHAEAQRLIALLPPLESASDGALCERLATHPRDATAGNPGVPFARLQQNAVAAIRACSAAAIQSPELSHYVALLARATAASGDLARAIDLYLSAAERGDLRAMVSLAQLKETGTGMAQDIPDAMRLYERAAEGGSQDAMINLAITLFEGKLLPQDAERAIALLKRAAAEGAPKAAFNLGVLAQDGALGDPAEALDYFRRAARDGEAQGYLAAAILLDEGRGVARDPKAAADALLRGAAEDDGTVLTQLTRNSADWTRETLSAVQARLAEAGVYASAIDGLPGPNFTAALTRWRNGGFDAALLAH